MYKKPKILIVGGDMRQIYCCRKLAENFDASLTGFDERYLPDNENIRPADLSADHSYDCAVLPVPPLDEKGNIFSPCASGEISPDDILRLLKKDGIIFAGKADSRLREIFSPHEVCDYILRESFALNNAVPTAEGAVGIALAELPVTINGMKVLVTGMGRIGTALVGILRGFGADVSVAVRSAAGAAKVRISGAKPVCMSDMAADHALVFNTVPEIIFTEDVLRRFPDDTLFIDLASKPGGIDLSAAAELGRKVVWASGLPGKTAPVTAGEITASAVADILSERGDSNG